MMVEGFPTVPHVQCFKKQMFKWKHRSTFQQCPTGQASTAQGNGYDSGKNLSHGSMPNQWHPLFYWEISNLFKFNFVYQSGQSSALLRKTVHRAVSNTRLCNTNTHPQTDSSQPERPKAMSVPRLTPASLRDIKLCPQNDSIQSQRSQN